MNSESLLISPEKPDFVSDDEGKINRLLEGMAHSFPGYASLMQYFQVGFSENRVDPSKIALYDDTTQMTFNELDIMSSKIAQVLKDHLGTDFTNQNPDGDYVFGICAPPCNRLVTLIFGIMKLGGAYVPYDTSFPEDRVIRITTVAKPLLIISDSHETTLRKFDPVKFRTQVITLEDVWAKAEQTEIESTAVSPIGPGGNMSERVAIVLFTSGSSGEPKGVRLTHRTVLNRLSWQWHEFPFGPDESCCFKTALTFVDSVPEIFGPLLQGRHVVVLSKGSVTHTHIFVQKIYDYKITRLTLVPSFLQALLTLMDVIMERDPKWAFLNSISLWVCSGETFNYDLLKKFFTKFPSGKTMCNFYGSTEIMGDVTYETFSSMAEVDIKCIGERGPHVPLGKALYNTVIYILTPTMELTPEGEIGEVCIAGYNLAKGYVGIKDSDKFIHNPYTKTHGFTRLYRTGDYGHIQYMKNGRRALFYDGRVDSQIKVRGHRVDLSEIETAVNESALVKKGVVLCYHPGKPDQAVIAFVVPENDGTAERISFSLEMKLLPYQIPKVRTVHEIPVLVNGKVDRQRLLGEYQDEQKHRPDFQDWEKLDIPKERLVPFKKLVQTIANVTGTSIHDIVKDLDDSFYNLGGTSLNSLTVISELRKLKFYISITDFVAAKNIRELVMLMKPIAADGTIDDKLGKEARQTLTPEMLTEEHRHEAIHIIASSFSRKGDLEQYLHVVYQDFQVMLESLWTQLVEKALSFIVRRNQDNKIIAVCLNFDAYDEPPVAPPCSGLETIFEFLEWAEAPAREKLPKGPKNLLHSFMMGTHEDLSEAENVYLIEFMEEEIVRLGLQQEFTGTFTTNTNALTQQIGIDVQGYTAMSTIQINQYEDKTGNKPFINAPDDQKAIVCWKRIDGQKDHFDES